MSNLQVEILIDNYLPLDTCKMPSNIINIYLKHYCLHTLRYKTKEYHFPTKTELYLVKNFIFFIFIAVPSAFYLSSLTISYFLLNTLSFT
jgi:hypothetical protein